MKMIRSALIAIGAGAVIAGILRLRGSDGVQPQSGGWRELTGPEFE